MGTFNYTDIHIFDKNGRELPLVINSSYKIEIPSKLGNSAVFYPVVNPDGSLLFYKESSGSRFDNSSKTVKCNIGETTVNAEVEYSSYSAIGQDGTDTPVTEYSIKRIISVEAGSVLDTLKFPCVELNSYVNFDVVSTELVETESLYVLVKTEQGDYVPIHDIDDSFGNRYELLFFIDNSNQRDFRFFNIENNDVVWTPDKAILNLNSSDEDGYRVNIGFCSEEEGIFKETLHVCLLDRGINKSVSLDDCEIIHIGSISLNAESIGEDERYRTLFTNFGIPDPKTYNDIFVNTSIEEDKIDNILLNQNSKKLFLTYSEIFPYIGTYKALINAVNVLGYDDLFFKEWYKRTGKLKNTGYISYDITYNSDANANIINNTSLEERIHLKKLNWLSMIYKLNEEIKTSADDQYGFPDVINKYNYHNVDLIAKLISLRDWLQKYIVGLNCKIIDVGGEGIYFERYKLGYYSTYQTLYDYNNETNLAPFIVDNTKSSVLVDCSTNIIVNVGVDDSRITFEDLSDKKFIDFCEGYFDSSFIYHMGQNFASDNDILIGKTLYSFSDLERYKIKADVSSKEYMLSHDNNINNNPVLDSSSASLIITDNRMFLNPLDMHNGQGCFANFEVLPVIAVKSVQLYENYANSEDSDNNDWVVEHHDTYNFNDYTLLYPVEGSSLRYCEDDVHGIPVFKIKNYDINKYIDDKLDLNTEYIINLIDCKFIFNLENEYDKTVVINFTTEGDNSITVNTTYYSNDFFVKEYFGDITHFIENKSYKDFISKYKTSSEDCVNYNFVSSVKVNTAGEYTVDVIGFDLHNNIFAARCKNNITVKAPNYNTITLTNYASDNIADSSIESYVKDNYINYCIFEKEYNIPFTKTSLSDKTAIEYSDALSLGNIKKNNFIHFSNKLEKFNVLSVNNTGSNTSAKFYKGDDIIDVYPGYDLTIERAYKRANTPYSFTNTVENFAKHSTNMFNDTSNDVNIVFYNELGGYPVYQTYGTICTDSSTGKLKVKLPDDTAQEYVWADAKTFNSKILAQELTKSTFVLLNNYEGSEWQNLEYANNIVYDCYLHFIEKIFNNSDISLNDITIDTAALSNKGLGNNVEDYTQEKMFDFLKEDDTDKYSPINYYIDSSNNTKQYCYLHNFVIDNLFDELDISNFIDNSTSAITAEKRKTFKSAYFTYNEEAVEASLLNNINADYAEDSSNYNNLTVLVNDLLNRLAEENVTLFKDFVIETELFDLLKTAVTEYDVDYVKTDFDNTLLLSSYVIDKFKDIISVEYSDIPENIDASLNSENSIDNLCNIIKDKIDADNYAYTYKLCTLFTYIWIGYIINKNDYVKDVTEECFKKFTAGLDTSILSNASVIAIRNYFEYRLDFNEYKGATEISGIDSLETLLGDLSGKGAKGMLIPYKYENTYDKYGSRLEKYVFTEEAEKISKDTGWITTDKLTDSSTNTDSSVNHTLCYAVAYKRDNILYYLKTSSMRSGGYSEVGTTAPSNYTFDLSTLAIKPEIGIYIEPILKVGVFLNKIDPRITSDCSTTYDENELYLPSNQLAVHITSSDYLQLNVGDNIKLIFNSAIINDRFGQSSYRVVDIDKDNHTWIIIEGNINDEYIRELGNYITYLPSNNAKWRGYGESWEDVCTALDECENGEDTDIFKKSKTTIQYVNPETSKTERLSCTLITAYYEEKEDFKTVKFNGEWRVLVSAKKTNELYNPRMYETGNTTLDIYISYAHTAYTDYVISSDSSSYDISEYTSAFDIKNTNDTLKYLDFIDSKFVMSSREFDTDNGIAGWMDLLNPEDAIKNPFGGIPQILSKDLYIHEHDLPILTYDDPNLIYCIALNNAIGLPAGYYAYWKIYKHSNTDTGKEYIFESYNPALYLDCNEPGIYDIELYVYDKFGNKSCTKIDGAFKVV